MCGTILMEEGNAVVHAIEPPAGLRRPKYSQPAVDSDSLHITSALSADIPSRTCLAGM